MDLLVVAKSPRPGRVKTRLCPPCTPVEAAALAEAALRDTLEAAVASGADRVVLALDGPPGPWLAPGVAVVPQGTGGLDARLAHAWSRVRGPALQVGMDTPQVTGAELGRACGMLVDEEHDAVLGPAADGGWWALGMREPRPSLLLGIRTSRPDTGACQRAALVGAGWRVGTLELRRDVDTWDDAVAVAASAPSSRFGAVVRSTAARVA